MPYAVINLADERRVAMVVGQKWQPVLITEEDWIEGFDKNPQPPAGYPENFHEVRLSEGEFLKIAAAIKVNKVVHIDWYGYVTIGEGDNQEGFRLKEFRLEAQFLGKVLDLAMYAAGRISRKQYQECQRQRDRQIDEIMAQ